MKKLNLFIVTICLFLADHASANDWAKQKFGIFIHYGWGQTPDDEFGFPITQNHDGTYLQSVNEIADSFNVQLFSESMRQIDPEYVIFTIWHGGLYPIYPSDVMEDWVGAYHRSDRDLMGEIIDSLTAQDIDVILYTQPSEAKAWSPEEQAKVGFTGKNSYSLIYNDFLNAMYAEIIERYGSKISGFWFDNGSNQGALDKARLRETILSRLPDAIMISINGANQVTDFGSAEIRKPYMFGTKEGFENIDPNDVETWPGLDKSVAFVNDQYWWSVPGSYSMNPDDMYKYNVIQAATCTEGGGVSWALGPFPGDDMWNDNVMPSMTDLASRINEVGEAIKNTLPSTSYPLALGTRINELEWGAATQSPDGIYEYFHIFHPPAGDVLIIPAPADGKVFSSAINLRTGRRVEITQTENEVSLTLAPSDSWLSKNVVIKLATDGSEIPTFIAGNLAEGKAATQSSIAFGGEPSRAVDGETNGDWGNGSVTHTVDETNPWWQVDLGEEYNIGDIVLWNRTDNESVKTRLSDFTVQVLNSNEELVWESTHDTYPDPSLTLDAEGSTGQFVRVMLNGTGVLSLAEVEVFAKEESIITGTSAESLLTNHDIRIYPNPTEASSEIHITKANAGSFELCDNKGRILLSDKIDSHDYRVQLQDLEQGVYFLKVMLNGSITTKKLLIK